MPALYNSNESLEPLNILVPLLTDALLAPAFLAARKLGSAIFMVASILFIVTSIVTSIISGVYTSSSSANSPTLRQSIGLNRTTRAIDNSSWLTSSFENIATQFPEKIISILNKFNLDGEECPQYLQHELSCVAYQYYPDLTSSVKETFGLDSFWYKVMDSKTQRFVDKLLDGASCKLKSFKCSTIAVLMDLQDRFTYKMFGADSPPSSTTTSPTLPSTTPSSTSTATTPKPESPIKPNENVYKLFLLAKNYMEKLRI